ncbi:transcription elongation factor GreAB [Candidatus Peregrinibacteria bacterium]|nr:MAG: transcription elongation factor GreAB [Candidatus Peregrinibacteria bacterium]
MKQKDIYLVNLNPSQGNEQSGTRPVVIISGDTMNTHLGVCIACPLSTKVKNFASCIILKQNKINNLSSDSEVITFQVRSISKKRFIKKIGEITTDELEEIITGIDDILHF